MRSEDGEAAAAHLVTPLDDLAPRRPPLDVRVAGCYARGMGRLLSSVGGSVRARADADSESLRMVLGPPSHLPRATGRSWVRPGTGARPSAGGSGPGDPAGRTAPAPGGRHTRGKAVAPPRRDPLRRPTAAAPHETGARPRGTAPW